MNIFYIYIYIFNLSLKQKVKLKSKINTGISKIDLVNCPLIFSSINLHKLSNVGYSCLWYGENNINVKNYRGKIND